MAMFEGSEGSHLWTRNSATRRDSEGSVATYLENFWPRSRSSNANPQTIGFPPRRRSHTDHIPFTTPAILQWTRHQRTPVASRNEGKTKTYMLGSFGFHSILEFPLDLALLSAVGSSSVKSSGRCDFVRSKSRDVPRASIVSSCPPVGGRANSRKGDG